jgi:hypothetical protein
MYNVILNYCRMCYPIWMISQMFCSEQNRIPPHIGLVLAEDFLTCIFLGAGLGVMDQFCGLRAHPILRRLSFSCGDALRSCLQDPATSLMNWSSELLLRSKQLHSKCWRETESRLDISRAHERRAGWSCLAFCSIDSISNKTSWVALSYYIRVMFHYFWFKNYRPRKSWQ